MKVANIHFAPMMARNGKKDHADPREYERLLRKSLPHVIQTAEENQHYINLLEQLDARADDLSPAQQDLADLLTLLIENFEERHYALKPATPLEILRELMESNRLKQRDLVDVFGTPSIISEIMNGKRGLTTEHIRRLGRRFHVSPELFL